MKRLLLLVIILLTSCGKSPLLNHEKENNQSIQGTSNLNGVLHMEEIDLYIKINWIKGPYPSPSLENQLIILVQNKLGELVDIPRELELTLWGWMPSMGHGTADDGYTERLSEGIYIQKELYFNMGGDWDINIELLRDGNIVDRTQIKLLL